MNGFQQCVGGLIGYGVSGIKGAALKNWQVLFVVSRIVYVFGPLLNSLCRCWVPSPLSGVSSLLGTCPIHLCEPHASVLVRTINLAHLIAGTKRASGDRILLAERVRKNETGIQNKEFKVSHLYALFHSLN